jgi:hypothetical protein
MKGQNWATFGESIIDKFSILLTLNLGGYTYEKKLLPHEAFIQQQREQNKRNFIVSFNK